MTTLPFEFQQYFACPNQARTNVSYHESRITVSITDVKVPRAPSLTSLLGLTWHVCEDGLIYRRLPAFPTLPVLTYPKSTDQMLIGGVLVGGLWNFYRDPRWHLQAQVNSHEIKQPDYLTVVEMEDALSDVTDHLDTLGDTVERFIREQNIYYSPAEEAFFQLLEPIEKNALKIAFSGSDVLIDPEFDVAIPAYAWVSIGEIMSLGVETAGMQAMRHTLLCQGRSQEEIAAQLALYRFGLAVNETALLRVQGVYLDIDRKSHPTYRLDSLTYQVFSEDEVMSKRIQEWKQTGIGSTRILDTLSRRMDLLHGLVKVGADKATIMKMTHRLLG